MNADFGKRILDKTGYNNADDDDDKIIYDIIQLISSKKMVDLEDRVIELVA